MEHGAADPGRDRDSPPVRRFPSRPIRTDAELDRAIVAIDELIARPELAPGERDDLDVLGALVAEYEAAAHPLPPLPDAAMLRYLMEMHGLGPVQLAEATGIAVATLSEVLSGRRDLGREDIGTLARYFRVSPGAFG